MSGQTLTQGCHLRLPPFFEYQLRHDENQQEVAMIASVATTPGVPLIQAPMLAFWAAWRPLLSRCLISARSMPLG